MEAACHSVTTCHGRLGIFPGRSLSPCLCSDIIIRELGKLYNTSRAYDAVYSTTMCDGGILPILSRTPAVQARQSSKARQTNGDALIFTRSVMGALGSFHAGCARLVFVPASSVSWERFTTLPTRPLQNLTMPCVHGDYQGRQSDIFSRSAMDALESSHVGRTHLDFLSAASSESW